jgi:hypothetical protein
VRALVVRLALLAVTIPLQLRIERCYADRGLARTGGLSQVWGRFIVAKVALVLRRYLLRPPRPGSRLDELRR